MLGRLYTRARWYLPPLIMLAIGVVIASSSAFAGVPPTNPTGNGAGVFGQAANGPASGFAAARAAQNAAPAPPTNPNHRIMPPRTADSFLVFAPGAGGPPNGGTVNVGDRFVLELWLNAGTNVPPLGATAQQSYLTYTYQLLQNARVSAITSTCTVTNTVTGDFEVFDAALQNEVCNGPSQCIFRGVPVDPGSFAYASGALSNCPDGCGGFFRVAQTGWCAMAPGTARLHWQFTPPAPLVRDTEIVALDGGLIHNPAQFADYVINISGGGTPTRTNTRIPTPISTPSSTNTRIFTFVPTNTPIRTMTATNTPSGGTPTPDAFLQLVPGTAGNCPAPANGGSTNVGCRFVLDLMLNAGSRTDATAAQSYLTFTYQFIQNANVAQIATSCVPTNTVTGDLTTFDATLQNEVCNGPTSCVFRGVTVGAGSFAYASGALGNPACTKGCGGVFRVAQVGICATNAGAARMHWQFTPPDPMIRDTEIVAFNTDLIHNRALFSDYVFTVIGTGNTPTFTPSITPGITNTRTNTPCPTGTPGLEDVMIMDFLFQPQVLNIQTGTFVRWTNHDSAPHTSTCDTSVWDSGTLNQNQQFQFMFLTPGTFAYHCAIHPGMTGTINVSPRPPCGTPNPTLTSTPIRTMTFTNTPIRTMTATNTPIRTMTATNTPSGGTPTPDAFLQLVPGTAGNCPAPANGGSTNVGCRFVLDLMLNAGSRTDATAAQSYLTFTYQFIQNANVAQIATSCVPTNTVTGDLTTFDATLQNEVCNGPTSCVFRGVTVGAGSFAYASGALGNPNCTKGCGGVFRVAQVGICATNAGAARMHWQFTPPDPMIRDTEIVAFNTDLIHNRALFSDYVFTVIGTGNTPTFTPVPATSTNTPIRTATWTLTAPPTNTRTRTITPVSTMTFTNTPVRTITFTGTPMRTVTFTGTPVRTSTFTSTPMRTITPCGQCNLNILVVTSSCSTDGTVHWIAVVHNPDRCAVTAPWRVELQVRNNGGNFRVVRIQFATTMFPPGDAIVDGFFCYHFSSSVRDVRVEYMFEDQERARSRGSNATIQERAAAPNSYSATPDSGIPANARSRTNPNVCDADMASIPMPPCEQTGSCGVPTPPPTGVPTVAPALPPSR